MTKHTGLIALSLSLAFAATEALAASGGGFGLSIRNQSDDYSGYVRMSHGTNYAVCFVNQQSRRADAELSIDGLPMGTWRLAPYQRACVERPADDTGRFTFYRANSSEGYAVGSAHISRSEKGLVSVRYVPEIERVYAPVPVPMQPYAPRMDDSMAYGAPAPFDAPMAESENSYAAPSYSQRKAAPQRDRLGAGVTGLSGQSNQHFGTAGQIERDYASAVTLELRLVHDPVMDRPNDPRPLPGRYDRLAPPPVGY